MHAPLFPVLFRNAGYKVFFITNQFVQALNTDIFNLSGGLFLNHDRLSKAQFDYRNTRTHRYDMGLLEDFDSLKQYEGNHNLFIFHLAGQHIDFYKRSPDKYKIFTISDYQDRIDINESEKQLVADYDNATYYNDIVIDSIIKRFEDDNAVLIYMPDHGEECFDGLHRMGRLPTGHYIPEVLRQEFCIPFWIWCSKSYIDTHSDIFKRIGESRTKPFMTDDLPHLLLYLAGISCNSYVETRNLLSPNFNIKRKRMINGKCDYDKSLK
jgi:heptose-I-phosphate ethanolaminephosphotransferase